MVSGVEAGALGITAVYFAPVTKTNYEVGRYLPMYCRYCIGLYIPRYVIGSVHSAAIPRQLGAFRSPVPRQVK